MALAAALGSAGPGGTIVFCAFDKTGLGSWKQSNVKGVMDAAQRGATVRWLAGGPLSYRLVVRLTRRSAAMVDSLDAAGYDEHSGIVGWITGLPPSSPGSWGTVRLAISRGLRCVIFPVGWAPGLAPPFGRGRWVQAGNGMWAQGLLWLAA
jgi:hypothetical protein